MTRQEKRRHDGITKPDVELTAEVKSRELRFEEVPETEVRFPGYPEGRTISGTERENLPEEVEEGVTYRNSRVRYRGAAQLPIGEPGRGSGKG